MLGDEFTDSYDKVDAEIVKTLLEEAKNDPASAYTLLVIRNIASSPFPADVDPIDENTPDISVVREKRKSNLETIIRNLIEHPDKENFRRLRMGNKLIAELLQLEYGQKFFEVFCSLWGWIYHQFRLADLLKQKKLLPQKMA